MKKETKKGMGIKQNCTLACLLRLINFIVNIFGTIKVVKLFARINLVVLITNMRAKTQTYEIKMVKFTGFIPHQL